MTTGSCGFHRPVAHRLQFIHWFIHSFIAICKVHYVENVESEALEAVARWSVIGKIVRFLVSLKAVECRGLSDRKWYVIPDLGAPEKLLCPKMLLQRGADNKIKFWLTEPRDRWGWWGANTEERKVHHHHHHLFCSLRQLQWTLNNMSIEHDRKAH